MGEFISRIELLNFRTKIIKTSLGEVTMIGNSGLHFIKTGNNWTWHYQPDGNSGEVDEKRSEYAIIFLAAFGEFIKYWTKFDTSKSEKPDLIQSITNPRMANFIIKEFNEGIWTSRGNFCNVCFDIPVIEKNKSLIEKFSKARESSKRQGFQMIVR